MENEIVILEDIGIGQEEFEKLAQNANLPYKIIWDKNSAKNKAVEILVTVKKTVNPSVLEQFPNVKAVAVAFTGYDSVDLEFCRENDIAVFNVPAYATDSVTELAVGLTIDLLREIPKADQLVKSKQWELQPGTELSGKTVGILGTGTIGIATAKVFKALGCPIIGWSRSEKDEFKSLGGQYISNKNDFFAQADIVSVHLPYNNETEDTVGRDELAAMKKSAYIVNTARGPIINEPGLIEALKNEEIAGAGLDVFAEEPLNPDNGLLDLNNVILTPHMAFKTSEALIRRAQITIRNIQDFGQDKTTNRVD